jgi:hypothetical protein
MGGLMPDLNCTAPLRSCFDRAQHERFFSHVGTRSVRPERSEAQSKGGRHHEKWPI